MGRKTTMNCDFCGAEIEQVAAKLYMAPVLPGKASTSFMSGYSHSADICAQCQKSEFVPKMKKRQARPSNGSGPTKKKTTQKRKTRA